MAKHLAAERRPLKKGSILEDRVRLELLGHPRTTEEKFTL